MAGFQEMCDALHGATLEHHSAHLSARTFAMTFRRDDGASTDSAAAGDGAPGVEMRLEDVRWVRWTAGGGDAGAPWRISAAGIERLVEGDVWRIYLNAGGAEIEAACGRIVRDGEEVDGVGRAYRSAPATGPAEPYPG
jgi:hypothetical protein